MGKAFKVRVTDAQLSAAMDVPGYQRVISTTENEYIGMGLPNCTIHILEFWVSSGHRLQADLKRTLPRYMPGYNGRTLIPHESESRRYRESLTAKCSHRAESVLERRPVNGLNLEIGTPSARCLLKEPKHWPVKDMASRWIRSGGSPLVFGHCNQHCPLNTKGVRP